jgi:VCBS repeat protein/FG-GAP repeat protein
MLRSLPLKLVSYCLILLAGIGLSARTSGQLPHRVLQGSQPGEFLGMEEIAFAGDLDGDGCDDLITGLNNWQQSNSKFFRVYSGADGSILQQWDIGGPAGAAVWSCSPAGDVNGDGVPDVVFGSLSDVESSVQVMSGADGSLIWKWLPLASGHIGKEVRGGGDVDCDGVPDVIARENNGAINESNVYVYSGATGQVLYQFLNSTKWPFWQQSFGRSLDFVGDVNGDGCDDFIVGDRDSKTQNVKLGNAVVFSGADGSELYNFSYTQAHSHFGDTVAGLGDTNGDGVPDFAIGAAEFDGPDVNTGLVHIYSGLDGSLLHEFLGTVAHGSFGKWVAVAGDVNQDGYNDVVVFGDEDANGDLLCRVYSGFDGSELARQSSSVIGGYGQAIAGAGDSNGDGWPDFAVAAPSENGDSGSIYIYPGNPVLQVGTLTAGQNGTFDVAFFAPSSSTWLAYSKTGLGSFPIAQLGISLDLDSPILGAGPNTSDALGEQSWILPIPSAAVGISLWLQAVQISLKTNVVASVVL